MATKDSTHMHDERIASSWLYRFAPLGCLSFTAYGMLVLAPALVLVGFFNKRDQFVASLQGEGLHLFAGFTLVWLLILAGCVVMSRIAALRHFIISGHSIAVVGGLGGKKIVDARHIKNIHTVWSLMLIAPRIRIWYDDNTSQWLDGRGLGDITLRRVIAFLGGARR